VRGNFWLGLRYIDLDNLNDQALAWLNGVANVRIHGTTGEVPFQRLPDEGLMPIHNKPDYDTSLVDHRRCSRDCFVSYEGNFYSVPADYATQRVMVKASEDGEFTVLNQQGEIIACRRLAVGSNQRMVVAEHHKGLHLSIPSRARPGAVQIAAADLTPVPWPDAPTVEVRSLGVYQDLLEVQP
jgi:hypothetical protein